MNYSNRLGAVSLAVILGLAAAACGSSTKSTSSTATTAAKASSATTAAAGAAGKNISACEVTDTGGVNDKGFNQSAYAGLTDSQTKLGVTPSLLESKASADYAPNLQQFVSKKCSVIISVGFAMDSDTANAAKANPGTQFAIIDSTAMDNNGTPNDFADDKKLPNVRALLFNTAEPSFMAGYLAAATTKSGTVGTYGGINIPPVTVFMEGFLNGVNYFNKQKGKTVKVLGWDHKNGTFVGDFTSVDKGKQITQSQVDAGADIVFPVAGGVGLGSSALAEQLGAAKLLIVGVDVDQAVSNAAQSKVYLVSVLKGIQAAVEDTVTNVVNTGKPGADYLGTLKNSGVGISGFHDNASLVSAATQAELDQIKADIISGKIDPAKAA
jgi:basic membrane protein A and related proteins